MTRYFMDCEFIEDGKTIDLISIGIVCEDGREYYVQSVEFDVNTANDWVWDNVYPHLQVCPYRPSAIGVAMVLTHHDGKCPLAAVHHVDIENRCPWRTREQIKDEILAFMDVEKHGTPEIWTYYGSYDHVALAQLFGEMIKLPQGWPMLSYDIEQFRFHVGSPKLPEQGKDEHNALADAKWNKVAWEFLRNYAQELNDHVARVLSNNKPAENFTQGVPQP